MDIKAICERKIAAQQALEYLRETNIYGKNLEELIEIDIAATKAQIKYNAAYRDYQTYIDSQVNKIIDSQVNKIA